MVAPYSFVIRDDNTRKTYDARVKNKFKWEWLTEKDTHGDFLSSDIRKIDADGRAVQLTVFQLIINGNKFVTFNRTNRLITAVISDPLHSL